VGLLHASHSCSVIAIASLSLARTEFAAGNRTPACPARSRQREWIDARSCGGAAMRCVRSLPVVLLAILPASCSYAPNDEANTAPKRGLGVEVRNGSGLYSVRGQYSVTIRFQNNGPGPVSIIEPLDGSTCGRHMPHYHFTMWDADLKPLEPAKGCGTWNDGRW